MIVREQSDKSILENLRRVYWVLEDYCWDRNRCTLNSAQIAHHPCPHGWLSESQNIPGGFGAWLEFDWQDFGNVHMPLHFGSPLPLKKTGIADGNQLWQHVTPPVSDRTKCRPVYLAHLSRPSLFLLERVFSRIKTTYEVKSRQTWSYSLT